MDEVIKNSLGQAGELVSIWGVRVIGAIAVLILGRWVAAVLRGSVTRAMARTKVDDSLTPFMASSVYYLALAVVLIAVLSLFGIETTSLVAVVGAAGLAIGLALQGTLSNFAAGVMLLIFKPFRKGDYVEAAGVAGFVDEIGIFVTTINTIDNVKIIAPNSEVGGGIIKNYSANANRRVDLVIGISYDDDIRLAKETIAGVVASDARVLGDPETIIAVGELGESSVDLLVRPWCKGTDYWDLRWDLTQRIKEELESVGCSIPFPQRDVHMQPVQSDAA